MSGKDRQDAILRAAARVFAEKGFHGATTRDLAAAAGVSEALLYRHFPGKGALYKAIGMRHLVDSSADRGPGGILAMPASTERLAAMVDFLISHGGEPNAGPFPRLIAHSLLEDGRFAQKALQSFEKDFFSFLKDSLKAAEKAGDLQEGIDIGTVEFWLAHHLSLGMRLANLPDRPAVSYGCPRFDLTRRATAFVLRGLGVREEAVRRCSAPRI